MKRCSTSLVIREIQLKTAIRYHFTAIKIVIIKNKRQKQKITSVGQDVEKLELLSIAGGKEKG